MPPKFAALNTVLPVSLRVSVPIPPVMTSLALNPALAIVTLLTSLPVFIVFAADPAVMTSLPAPHMIEIAVVNPPASMVIPAVLNRTDSAELLSALVANVTFALNAVKSKVWILVTLVNIESVIAEVPVTLSVLLPVPPLIISALERLPTA